MNSTYKSTLKALKRPQMTLKAGLLSRAQQAKQRARHGCKGGVLKPKQMTLHHPSQRKNRETDREKIVLFWRQILFKREEARHLKYLVTFLKKEPVTYHPDD